MNQLEILSDQLREFITRTYPDYSNSERESIKAEHQLPLDNPEFGIFNFCKVAYSPTSFVVMLQNNDLKLSHLNKIVKLINHLYSIFGKDDYEYEDFDYDVLSEIVDDDEEEYIEDVRRIWKENFDNNCTCVLDISFQENNALFIINFEM